MFALILCIVSPILIVVGTALSIRTYKRGEHTKAAWMELSFELAVRFLLFAALLLVANGCGV